MKLAIMQPYLFPYIGYFQLIHAVDKFVSYDDVNFIKQGWINRNRLLISGKPNYITVPLKNASSFTPINQVTIAHEKNNWRAKWLKMIQQSYGKAAEFHAVFPIVAEVISEPHDFIAQMAMSSLKAICQYLEIETEIAATSANYQNSNLSAEARVLDICQKEDCRVYINPIGGRDLYSKTNFLQKTIELKFLQPQEIQYSQFNLPFSPWLSIIDVLMHNSKACVQSFLNEYQLL